MPLAASGLIVYAYDDAALLWQEMLRVWRENSSSRLVFGSGLARARFLRAHTQQSLWNQRVINLGEITEWAQSKLSCPPSLLSLQLQTALRQMLDDSQLPPELQQLRSSENGVRRLLQHLNDIEAYADRSYAPQTAIERGLQRLRERIHERGLVSEVTNLSQISREAYTLDAQTPLLFAPVGEPSPHLTGLMKGLAQQQAVSFYLQTTASQLPTISAQANLQDEQVESSFSTGYVQRLFTEARPTTQRDERHHWIKASDEAEAAIDLAWAWVDAGVSSEEIAIICPRPDEHSQRLADYAVRRGLALHTRGRVRAHDTALGALLLRLAREETAVLADPARNSALLTGDGRHFVKIESYRGTLQQQVARRFAELGITR